MRLREYLRIVKMTLSKLGESTSAVEVTNISANGFWLFVGEKEYFLPYEKFPWFRDAKVGEILDVELLHGFHLHWPKLDVDLEVTSLDAPERFPLMYSAAATK
jgi:hypothetical protein